MDEEASHEGLAAQLRRRVLETGVIGGDIREGVLLIGGGAAGGIPAPYDALARQIGQASYRVTDRQVADVREAAGSDKAAFEVVISASIGAGLHRWDVAARAIEGASGATS